MRQFVGGSDAAFTNLELRARRACVVFADTELPPGADPARARVGFEVNPTDGSARLYVDQGVRYSGGDPVIREWFTAGEIIFSSFEQLIGWIRGDLAACYARTSRSDPAPVRKPEVSLRSPDQLTDLTAVHIAERDECTPLYLNAGALRNELAANVRGQHAALRTLARRVTRHVARHKSRRPATLFAVGPTGVGKTTTAEALPSALRAVAPSGASYGFLRLDMAEYQERHRVSQLLGAPQGYVGYGDGAQLIDTLAANPRTVVLFDEIEKAHPQVLIALMNAMDAGRLSTAARATRNREIDCRAAIFIFTSNVESDGILEDLAERDGFEEPAVVDAVCRARLRAAGIAPELVGRIGAFLVFRSLTAEARAEIVTVAVARIAAEYGLRIVWIAPEVITYILDHAGSGQFGARPDEYLIDEVLGEAFAEAAAQGMEVSLAVHGGPPFTCIPAVG